MNHAEDASGLYFSHPACLLHDPRVHSPGHPDTPERLVALEAALAERDWLRWDRREAPELDPARLELVHSAGHVRAVRDLCARGGGLLDPDTSVVEASFPAALHAAGAGAEMVRALLAGESSAAFCGVRPAGHHAEAERAMGFCLFNNIALAAAVAISDHRARRVMIIDWDVHAGNGTAEIFRRRSDVLFACIHEHGLYPGTGRLEDSGSGEGEGYTINMPVPPGSEEALWLALVEEVVLPAARAYAPDLILVSAGFDAHRADPLARCRLETVSFARIAWRVHAVARELGVPLGVMLEGGYHSGVLADCVCAVLPVLAGADGRSAAADVRDHEGDAADLDEADRVLVDAVRAQASRGLAL